MTPLSGRSSDTPREWWLIYGAVDRAMARELGTSPSMVASAVYDALNEAGALPLAVADGDGSGDGFDSSKYPAEAVARAFHEEYERLAPSHGYKTREASAVPWADVPNANKSLMVDVVSSLIAKGVIRV